MRKYREHRTCATLAEARESRRYAIDSGRKAIIRTCKVWTVANWYSHKVTGYRVLVAID